MTDVLIASSVLILALLALRRVFRKTLSRRMQYALWALVLIRLLIPNSIFGLPYTHFSVITVTSPVRMAVTQQVNRPYYSEPIRQMTPEALRERNIQVSKVPTAEEGGAMILVAPPKPDSAEAPQWEGYLIRDPETDAVTLYGHMAVGPWELLDAIWKAGMVAVGAWFAFSNARFYWKLRKNRTAYETDSKRRVYLLPEGVLPSPCLFGRSIYLTPAAVETPDKLRHVLAHEETHAKHLDPLWSLLRCVCLIVYWFDPLVWIAASCAKTDCELACDEGALALLGETERIPYGQTLLSLIPVRKGPSDPMISATTMTAGKRQLKDRITRIAKHPRQLAAAVLAMALLVTLVSACTFTNGFSGGTAEVVPSPSSAPSEGTFRTLTGPELEWFNRQFFNSPDPEADYSYNIRNQFASPINLYDRPEDIDLFDLFYLEGSAPTGEELRSILNTDPNDLPCPAYKLTAAEMDEVLKANTGLTVAETAQKGLNSFTYDTSTDAYYWMHGDTNYCGGLDFTLGIREGSVVTLYHNSGFSGGGWYCVTLSEQGEGEYWFVSNQECEVPAIPPAMPSGEPTVTISLKSLTPYVSSDGSEETVDLALLAQSQENSRLVDLDGDGTDELAAGSALFFQRDGQTYQADLKALLLETCPELDYWDWEQWDIYGRRLYVTGLTGWDEDSGGAMWARYLYFDGGNILVYKETKTAIDHVVDGLGVGVPAEVVDQAKEKLASLLVQQDDGTYRFAANDGYDLPVDDWRLDYLSGPDTFTLGNAVLEVWSYGGQVHTTDPAKFVWAGGSYMDEDGWCSLDHSDFYGELVYQVEGGREFLFNAHYEEGGVESVSTRQWLFRDLEAHGVDVSPTTYAALEAGLYVESLSYGGEIILHGYAGGRTAHLDGAGEEVLASLTDPAKVQWSRAEAPAQEPAGESVTLRDDIWYDMLQFWADSDLVKYKNTNDPEPTWYRAVPQTSNRPFDQLRALYDAAA